MGLWDEEATESKWSTTKLSEDGCTHMLQIATGWYLRPGVYKYLTEYVYKHLTFMCQPERKKKQTSENNKIAKKPYDVFRISQRE